MIISSLQQSVLSGSDLSLTSKPFLHELDLIEVGEKKIRVIDRVAADWEEVATRLHFEGHEIKRIKKDQHHQCKEACHATFGEWLDGNGREPKNFETLLKVLEEAGFSEFANKLRQLLHNANSASENELQ